MSIDERNPVAVRSSTTAHVGTRLEIETDYAIAHGEAVAVGSYAAHLAHGLGSIDPDAWNSTTRSWGTLRTQHGVAGGLRSTAIDRIDGPRQKALSDGLTFVLDGPFGVEVVTGVSVDAANDAFTAMTLR